MLKFGNVSNGKFGKCFGFYIFPNPQIFRASLTYVSVRISVCTYVNRLQFALKYIPDCAYVKCRVCSSLPRTCSCALWCDVVPACWEGTCSPELLLSCVPLAEGCLLVVVSEKVYPCQLMHRAASVCGRVSFCRVACASLSCTIREITSLVGINSGLRGQPEKSNPLYSSKIHDVAVRYQALSTHVGYAYV